MKTKSTKPTIPDIALNDDELANITRRAKESNIIGWINFNGIKNEKGDPIEFETHPFLFDIYLDQSPNIAVMKPAQVGLSTLQVLKNHYDAKKNKLDIIYTLPTENDVSVFVGGKVNRIVSQNECMETDVKDKDSIEQKQIGESFEYFRGTWTKKAAIMITADRLTHDEIDSSKLDVIADYQARLQHSKAKQTHVFSHPSVKNKGVHSFFLQSDQKEWFITCPHCHKLQYLTWDTEKPEKMSIDFERKEFICKKCRGILSDADRADGEWRPRKFKEKPKFSGYHISLLMAPWVSAKEIIEKYQQVVDGKQTMDFFYNKVLGLPWAGGGNTVDEETIMSLVTESKNTYQGRLIIGVDPGAIIRYVIGNAEGLLGYGTMKAYAPDNVNNLPLHETLEYFLKKFPNSIMVIDQGGDITPQRALRAKYPGRVFLCFYRRDRKTMQLIQWGEGDETGNVIVDRNRMIQLVADEARDKRFKLYNGTKADWYDYYQHWGNIYRVWQEDGLGVPQFQWLRDGRDDYVHCTVYWRVGVARFGIMGGIVGDTDQPKPNSYIINADGTATFDPAELLENLHDNEEEDEWRD